MAFFLGHWPLRGYGMWAIASRASGRLIGRAGFINPEGWPGLELGWLLARDAWGEGYATEASRAALESGRSRFGAQELISLIRPANLRSIAVAERLGATLAREIDFLGNVASVYLHAFPARADRGRQRRAGRYGAAPRAPASGSAGPAVPPCGAGSARRAPP
jgi:RimJ/RimL family protein N-acetyltransferase